MLTDKNIKEILSDIIPDVELIKLIEEANNEKKQIIDFLIEKKIISSFAFYEKLATFYKLPFADLKNQIIRKDVLMIIPEPIAVTHRIIAFGGDDKNLKIATTDPQNLEIIEFIRKTTEKDIQLYITTPENINDTMKQYHKSLKAEFDTLATQDKKEGENEKNLKEMAEDLPIVKVVETLLEYAIYEGASDVHIEPSEKSVNVRYRVDGVLRNVMDLPKNLQSGIIARIKILSNLKVDEHRLPQDGRIKVSNNEYNVSFRVSTIPTYDGEKIVLRLLNEKSQILTLEQLGLQPSSLEIIKRNINRPHGMFLVTGPTGSGKSTTLYTVLNILNKPDVNISTIEDPIEYHMPHINQSQVNAKIGFTFAMGLRAFLRQDPDIIMVGEIRDNETAEIAMHAAMTGHLVLSTLHTNDAPTTIPRLMEMGVASFLAASNINVIIAQRLVRKICPGCIQSYNLDKQVVDDLKKQLNVDDMIDTLKKQKVIASKENHLETMLFYRGKGCKQCGNTGYKGRIGIYETLEITEDIANLILKKADNAEIKKKAKSNGMLTIIEDGFIKAKNGITTIEEIMRVTKD
jgi:type IV pilus assembly protein PilB